ncbi:hypothetical protein C1645_813042 [Glomus cerebriforme]|uniref:HCP-like protein n=1 Tax=Glomus cerebriforme TaxID=658196 RepID=A0A397TLD3_9GLOM|nr:hypothetical protein C1645_813042 [Glomus cerebriforme]
MINLGDCYENGIGTSVDKQKAFELYQKAADLGDASGVNYLGVCYKNGIGTSIDIQKAFELYQKAADLGDSAAQYNLAMIGNQDNLNENKKKKNKIDLSYHINELRGEVFEGYRSTGPNNGIGVFNELGCESNKLISDKMFGA